MKTMLPNLTHASNRTAPAYWMLDILWTVLVTSDVTEGRYSLIEQIMPQGAAPPPHVHPYGAELFYLLEGDITYHAGDKTLEAAKGSFVVIPANTVHHFEVKNASAHVLNFYVPGGWETVFPDLARPAEKRELPPKGLDDPQSPKVIQFLTNYWGAPANLSFASQRFGRDLEDRVKMEPLAARSEEAEKLTVGKATGASLARFERTGGQFAFQEWTLLEGQSLGFEGDAGARCLYVLEGGLEVTSESLTQSVSPGECLFLPAVLAFHLESANGEAVRFLMLVLPGETR